MQYTSLFCRKTVCFLDIMGYAAELCSSQTNNAESLLELLKGKCNEAHGSDDKDKKIACLQVAL